MELIVTQCIHESSSVVHILIALTNCHLLIQVHSAGK